MLNPDHTSPFRFTQSSTVSEPITLPDGQSAQCLLFGHDKTYAVVLTCKNGELPHQYLFTRDGFSALGNQSFTRDSDLLHSIQTYGDRLPNSSRARQQVTQDQEPSSEPPPESDESRTTRLQRDQIIGKFALEQFGVNDEFKETAAQLQTVHEAKLSERLRNDNGELDPQRVEKIIDEAVHNNTNIAVPLPQTSSIVIPAALKSTTSITYTRLQLPNDKGGIAEVIGPVFILRFDFIELNGALYRETITYNTAIKRYIENYRKEVLKETAIGFGLSIGIGLAATPPGDTNETAVGQPRFENGKPVKDDSSGEDPDSEEESNENPDNNSETSATNEAPAAAIANGQSQATNFIAGISASFSVSLAFKKHKIITRNIDNFVAEVKPHERIIDRLH